MSDFTALDRLDEAVRAFIEETSQGDPGVLSGWIIGYQTSTFTDDPALVTLATRSAWTMSASTTAESGIGLLRLTTLRLERDLLSYESEGD